jgi:hypothetical protein
MEKSFLHSSEELVMQVRCIAARLLQIMSLQEIRDEWSVSRPVALTQGKYSRYASD